MVILWLIAGLVVLSFGAEILVRSASSLAAAVGISPLVIGLTVVAFGTGAPELVVSIQSTLVGQSDVALGNVIGSNLLNVLLILGLSAVIVPLHVSHQLIRFDVPVMIALSIAVWAIGYDGRIGSIDGVFLTAGLAGYTLWAIVKSRREQTAIKAEYEAEFGAVEQGGTAKRAILNAILLAVGLGLLILGSRWFVASAIILARNFGISELVIGLTIVAAGTSLPEVATSVMAAIRGERDIAVGNVIGSNIFNILGVLGISSLVAPAGITVSAEALRFDLPVMIAVAIACLPIFFTGHRIARWEGGLFLAYYIAYTSYIVMAGRVPAVTRTIAAVMIGFVIPLTILTLLIGVVRFIKTSAQPESVDPR